jgi:hypothetical protein
MSISATERMLRVRAAQSALASARLDGVGPSQYFRTLLNFWAQGAESLDNIHDLLMAHWRQEQ